MSDVIGEDSPWTCIFKQVVVIIVKCACLMYFEQPFLRTFSCHKHLTFKSAIICKNDPA